MAASAFCSDEFKDYPESALYMIGAIGEAKGTAKPDPSTMPAKPRSNTAAEPDSKPAAELRPKATSEPRPNAGAKPLPKLDHIGGTNES